MNSVSQRLRLSVVTPAYNQASFLRETVDSVLCQDYPEVEYRAIDDGSNDETPHILGSYTGRLMWESQSNQGQTATINKGWELATGDVLTWLNSDDTFLPGAVRIVMEFFHQNPDVDVVYGDTLFTDPDGTPIHRHRTRTFDYEHFVIECHNLIPQPSAFIRRRVIEDVGLLDPYYYYHMDWEFWLRAGIRHQIRYIPELLSTYRLHAESKTVSQTRRAAPELEHMYEAYFSRTDVPAPIRRQQRRAFANMYFNTGGYYLQGHSPRDAARSGWRALQSYPELSLRPGMVHKLIYCLLGGTSGYQSARSILRGQQKAAAH